MKLPQIILAVLALGVGVFLYFMPFAPIAKEVEGEEVSVNEATYSIADDINDIKNKLDSAALARINGFELVLNEEDETSKGSTLDSLIAVYDQLRQPTGAAYYALQRAELDSNANHWTEAGERFLLNAKYIGEQARKANWFAQSKVCFEKAVELAPDDLDIMVDLGVCMIEGASLLGTPPMEGIGMLKKVEQMDPNNIKVLINLGYFAIRSGQYEKAEERFNKVLEIDKNYIDAYLYLADLHEKQKKPDLAIADLENYKSQTEDPQRIKEVDEYIDQLKQNI